MKPKKVPDQHLCKRDEAVYNDYVRMRELAKRVMPEKMFKSLHPDHHKHVVADKYRISTPEVRAIIALAEHAALQQQLNG